MNMQIIASAVGVMIVMASLYVMIFPVAFRYRLPELLSGARLYMVALVRLLIGCLLLAVAGQSRQPGIMAGLGWLTVIAGLLLVAIPPDTMSNIVQWYTRRSSLALRLMTPLAMAYGAYIIYGVNY